MLLASSLVIQDINTMSKNGLTSLAIFYYNFREGWIWDLWGLVLSLLVQFCHQSDSYCDILSNFYLEYSMGLKYPSNNAIVKCLKKILYHISHLHRHNDAEIE